MDNLERGDILHNKIWEMDTFLEKFEAYHDLMAFNGNDRDTYQKIMKDNYPIGLFTDSNIVDHDGEYGHSFMIKKEHLEKLHKYCKFLNEIPTKYHKDEVDCLLSFFSEYSSHYREYSSSYENLYDENDNRKDTINMSDKLKSHIRIARKFRESLEIDDRTNPLFTYNNQKEHGNLSKHDNFTILKGSLEKYIEDLETKTFKMRSRRDYQNFFPKPPLDYFISFIKKLVKKYNIKNTTSQIKDFKKEINLPY